MATITNKMFAESNETFKKMCKEAGCEPTERQASKFQNEYGKAYKYLKGRRLTASKR